MGYSILFFFVLVFSVLLTLVWLISRKQIVGNLLGLMWLGAFGLIFLSGIVRWLTDKTELDHDDYYGEYIVDRDYFPGRQADWQYEHFRFEIKENDSIYFYVTDEEKVIKTYPGIISTSDPSQHASARLILHMDSPTHHILFDLPTTYRSAWSFFLVFDSPRFKNMFFKKGRWKPLED